MRAAFRLFVLVAGLALSACYPTTREAIGIASGPVNDPYLTGVWQGHISGDAGNTYLFFLSHPPEPPQIMLIRPGDGKDPAEWANFSLVVGKAGTHGILNVQFDNGSLPRDEAPDFTPMLYRIEADGALHMFLMNSLAAEDIVRANRMAGEIVSAGKSADVTFTGDPKTLDAFFAANAPKYFTVDFGTFRRSP